jgi:hypothetical protein
VAAAQETQPRHALRAISLLAVLVTAKGLSLWLAPDRVAWSAWAPVAYLWQDVLVVLLFLALDVIVARPRLGWIAYGVVATYAAINVPIAAVLSTPLTVPMLRAAGGAISDSIARYATVGNFIGLLLPLAAAAALPRLLLPALSRVTGHVPWLLVTAGLAIVALGPFAVSRADTRGMHRNALGALAGTALPRVSAVRSTADWRASPFGEGSRDDLSSFAGRADGRNVVLIALESTAARYLRPYGADRDPMPALTALARNAIVFDRAYAVYPESIKGLFATLCSQYPAFDTPPEIYADVACDPLPLRLRASGYQTALFHSGRFEYLGMRSIIDRRGYDLLEDAGAIGGNVMSSFGVDEASTVARILAWIDARDRRAPFFITYLPVAGHHPYPSTGPRPFNGTTDFDRYLNALHEGDEAIGAFVAGLGARGLDKNTLFVVFGDHGEAFGQHPGNYAHTLFVYDENVHVPLVIAAPGVTSGDIRVRRATSVIDIAPTILALLGLNIPSSYEGASLLEPRVRMSLFYTDYSMGWLGLVDGCWKYLFEVETGNAHLFDVCADSGETRDLSASYPGRCTAYGDRVRKWAEAQKAARQGLTTGARASWPFP